MANKVQFNLKNVYYAVIEGETDSSVTYATPVAVPGAVSISLSEQSEMEWFYADGIKYYKSYADNGYDGDLEMALIPDSMKTAIWGDEILSTSKVLVQNANSEPKDFALLFQIDGDATNSLYVLYKCSATRPEISGKTNENKKSIETQKCGITAIPLPTNGRVLAKTTADTTSTVVEGWFSSVFVATT